MRPSSVPRSIGSAGPLTAFAVAAGGYAIAGWITFRWFTAGDQAPDFFPAAGVSLALLVLLPRRRWPFALLGVAAAEFALDLWHGLDPLPSLGFALANAVEPLVGASIFLANAPTRDLARRRSFLVFMAGPVALGPLIGATIGATVAVRPAFSDGWQEIARSWWVGDALGVLVIGSAILTLVGAGAEGRRALVRPLAAGLIAATVLATIAAFWLDPFPFAYVPPALLFVIALRVGSPGVAIAGSGIAVITAIGSGADVPLWGRLDLDAASGTLAVQAALLIVIAAALALAAEVGEVSSTSRRLALEEARRLDAERRASSARELEELYVRERRARRRLAALHHVMVGLSSAGSADEVAVRIAELALEPLEADSLGLILIDERGRARAVAASGSVTPHADLEPDVDLDAHTPTAEAIRTRRTVAVDRHELEERFPASVPVARRLGLQSLAAIPLLDGDAVLGVLSVGFATPTPLDSADADYLQLVARECRRALTRARRDDEERLTAQRNELRRRLTTRLLQEPDATSVVQAASRMLSEALSARAAGAVLLDQPGTLVLAGTEELDRTLATLEVPVEVPAEQLARWASAGEGRSAFCEGPDEILALWPDVWTVTQALGLHSMAVLPLIDERGPFGAFAIAFGDDRTFDRDTRAFLEAVGGDLQQALIRTRLTSAERAAKRAADRAAERASLLAAVSREVPVFRTVDERLEVFFERLVPRFADLATARLLDRDTAEGPVRMSDPRWKDALADPDLGALVADAELRAGSNREVVTGSVDPQTLGDAERPDPGAFAVIPLERRGRLLGTVLLLFERYRGAPGPDDIELLRGVGHRVAISIENAYLFERQQRIAVALQQSLTGELPGDVPGLEVAVHRAVGERGASAGGDWCDVIGFADGRPGLLIGDVMGRGLDAAAAMGQLRAAVIALSHVSDGPAELLRRLDAVADRFPGAEMATIGCLAIDPVGGRITHASAGHLPPLVISDDGATFLWGGRSLPLGVEAEVDRREESYPAAAGTIALLYTDGLIERRGESIDAGLARLVDAAAAARDRSAERLVDAVLELGTDGSHDDDVTVIAARIETSSSAPDR